MGSGRIMTSRAGTTGTWPKYVGEAMPHGLRHRFWLESMLGSITGVTAVITIFWHDWIEAVFDVNTDKSNGSAEWLVVLILLILTATLIIGVSFEWRRARLAER
jgi:tetrahydromethanopterin S-methyltransferase subunit E